MRRIGDCLALSLVILIHGGCATFVSSEEWRCVDDKGNPLPGVFALYAYFGTGAGPGYVHEGGYVISDLNGVLTYPPDKVAHTPIFDSAPNTTLLFLYSEKAHLCFSTSVIPNNPNPMIENDQARIYVLPLLEGSPDLWFLSLQELNKAVGSSLSDTANVIGHLKTGQCWPLQNQPLGGWLG